MSLTKERNATGNNGRKNVLALTPMMVLTALVVILASKQPKENAYRLKIQTTHSKYRKFQRLQNVKPSKITDAKLAPKDGCGAPKGGNASWTIRIR
jgi:hypothetical protein